MAETPPTPPPQRDAWAKADIILKPVGGLLTAVAVAILGFWTSSYLREREGRDAALRERMQTSETNARLYSELTSKREEAESALRKDMFTSIINSFLRSGPATLEQKMLNLELLVYNFHESLNLKPLFLHLEREMKVSSANRAYLTRLYQVADEVTRKQMLVIEEGGERFDATIDTKTLAFPSSSGEGESPAAAHDVVVDGIRRNVKLEVLAADPGTEQLQVRTTLRTSDDGRVDTSSTEFWVGHFDFPMIDNTRLPHDQRLAVVLNNFDAKRGVADVTVICYPGKYAALREKPYYDEVLAKLLAANRGAKTPARAEKRTPASPPQ
ncbi:MAG TPA: hypothetical protein VIZ58_09385 [Thermoanaerobaculia bacterium]